MNKVYIEPQMYMKESEIPGIWEVYINDYFCFKGSETECEDFMLYTSAEELYEDYGIDEIEYMYETDDGLIFDTLEEAREHETNKGFPQGKGGER